MRDSLDEMLPAHLAYDFQHVINIDDETDDGDNGKPDTLIDINDESTADVDGSAFFMHAEFPIAENIPYGKHYDALKYDGNVQAKAPNSFNGGLRYDSSITYNGIATDTTKIPAPCKWWFVSTGESIFNKEFQHDGAIRYDGLKPQEIEFDDGMDEVSSFEIIRTIDEELISQYKFDGSNQFNGIAEANVNQIPTDDNGYLELKRLRYFDGKNSYDGGDINYFNGAIKADGNFNFNGNGIKAQIETLIDNLDGELDSIRIEKDKPLSDYYPEMFDYVPLTLDRQSIEISESAIDESVNETTDDNNALSLSKAIRYDGLKIYNGGDLNYFDGSIKADGKFNFKSSGNQAKIEVIAIDLDNSLSFQRIKKDLPIPYVEVYDFVNATYDEQNLSAQFSFDDIAEPADNDGNLIIRQRLKFDGYARYKGNFEHIEDSYRKFNGKLNYNNLYRIIFDGDKQFNFIV